MATSTCGTRSLLPVLCVCLCARVHKSVCADPYRVLTEPPDYSASWHVVAPLRVDSIIRRLTDAASASAVAAAAAAAAIRSHALHTTRHTYTPRDGYRQPWRQWAECPGTIVPVVCLSVCMYVCLLCCTPALSTHAMTYVTSRQPKRPFTHTDPN
ncbi:unnamed protein product [Protopolystoma xenopodis]|uniref:Uncharacterized protein n=1 Tax=Protopolystoma xenopodis TaxID=117903 RepID=A0A3S5B646_9PLAT|nr:unnamed protein product [Protopolystoma xenopodis]